MAKKLTVQEIQDIHFTSVEKFLNAWAARKINQKFLRSLPNKKGAIAKVLVYPSSIEYSTNFLASSTSASAVIPKYLTSVSYTHLTLPTKRIV